MKVSSACRGECVATRFLACLKQVLNIQNIYKKPESSGGHTRTAFTQTGNPLHLNNIQRSYNHFNNDIPTHFRHNIKKCTLRNKDILQIKFNYNFISVSLK